MSIFDNAGGSPLFIAVAEDDPVSRLMLQRWLQPHAQALFVVERPEDAWPLIESRQVNVLVTDLRFEGRETGLDLAERVRAWSVDFPIILITAFGDQDALVHAIELGVDHVLIKPAQRVLLRQMIQKVSVQIRDREALRAAQAEIAEQQARLRTLRDYEQRIGAHVQQHILYQSLPAQWGALRCTQRVNPVHSVNGDFVDGFASSDGALDIVVGDAMGKGLSAAMLGAGLKATLMRLLIEARAELSIEDICCRLSRELQPVLEQLEGLITLQYWRIGLYSGTFRFVDCGHTKAVLQRAGASSALLLNGKNLPLGVLRDDGYVACELVLMRGDRLLLVSDGIVDAFETPEQGGLEGLLALIEGTAPGMAGDLADAIVAASDAYAADDRSLLLLEWAPAVGPVAQTLQIFDAVDQLTLLRQRIAAVLDQAAGEASESWRVAVEAGVVEAVTNAFRHGEIEPTLGAALTIAWNDEMLTCELVYRGVPFRPERPAELPPDYSEGGYGLYVIEHCFDRVHYFADRDRRQAQLLVKFRAEPASAG